MKIRHALAGLLAAIATAGLTPAAMAATPTAAKPGNIYNEAAPAARKAQAAAATCPAQGHRIKVSSDPTVYLVGPGNVLYYFPDSTDYFGLYTSYNGISTVSTGVRDACFAQSPDSSAYALTNAHLDKLSGTPDVYIWDAAYGTFRWITSQSVFNRYEFASSKIQTVSGLGPIGINWS
jgi:hypothetical protein